MAKRGTSPQLYWAPDKDPSWAVNPGVLTEVSNLVPTSRGTLANYACTSGEQFLRVPSGALANTRPRSAAVVKQASTTSGQRARMIIGTAAAGGGSYLLEAIPGTGISDVSRAAGGPYGAAEFQFCGFGDTVIATCSPGGSNRPSELPQSSATIGGAFANLAGATIMGGCCTVNNGHLVIANVYDGATWYGDGWACSGLQNLGSWVANLAAAANLSTGANWGRMLDRPGQVRNLVNMRDRIIAYKADAMFMGTRTGNPLTWSWNLCADGVGQSNGNGVAVVKGIHYFLHRTGAYAFDGSSVTPIGEGWVNTFLANKLQQQSAFDVTLGPRACVDEQGNRIFWFITTNEAQQFSDGDFNCALVYNYVTRQWGWIDATWADNVNTDSGFGCPVRASREDLMLWDSVAQMYPGIFTVGSLAGVISLRVPVIGRGSLRSQTTSSFTTGDVGDDDSVTLLTAVKPRLIVGDDDLQLATCVVDGKMSQAELFDDEGFVLQGTATGTGSGGLTTQIYATGTTNLPTHTFAADDYMSFDYKIVAAASLTTQVGIRVATTLPSTLDALVTPSASGQWLSGRVALAAISGQVSSFFQFMIGPPAATGAYKVIFRRVRITDVNGVLRRRLWTASEERVIVGGTGFTLTTNVTPVVPAGGQKSSGVTFTYDPTLRKFAGSIARRFHRPKITLYNQVELTTLDLELAPAGDE